jgi:putative tricarboxylic transport membrane protein
MARKGRAGPALGIAAFGSFIAGTAGLVGLMFFALPLAKVALDFGPPEYFAVILLGLTLVAYLARGSKIKAFIMGAFGLILSCVGLDWIDATPRFNFSIVELMDGIDMVPLAMGLFGISEILLNVEETTNPEILKTKIKNLPQYLRLVEINRAYY